MLMLKRIRHLGVSPSLLATLLTLFICSTVSVLAAEDVSLTRGTAASPGPALGSLAAGYNHSCAVLYNGVIYCWGDNTYGQSTPPSGATSVQVSGGFYHTCGLSPDSTVACWGSIWYGESTPPAGAFTQVTGGGMHTCGLRTDGTVACWGDNSYGETSPPF